MEAQHEVEVLAAEVHQVIIALDAIASSPFPIRTFGDNYKTVGVNFSLRACKLAAEITGYDRTFCKMLNHKFRTDAASMMFERACADLGLPFAA